MKRTPTWMHTTGPSPLLGLRIWAWRIVPASQRRWRRLCQAAKVGGCKLMFPKFRLTRTCPWCLREWMAMILLQNCCWRTLIYPLDGDAGSDQETSDNDAITPEELNSEKKEEGLKKDRKKAGLPELELDALPSSLANKMSTLFLLTRYNFLCFLMWQFLVINVDWGIWPKIVKSIPGFALANGRKSSKRSWTSLPVPASCLTYKLGILATEWIQRFMALCMISHYLHSSSHS